MVTDKKESEEDFISIGKMLKEFLTAEEVLEREITALGNSAHIRMPVKHKGKKARVFVLKGKKKKTQEDHKDK